jgi:PDZ domain-containing protein
VTRRRITLGVSLVVLLSLVLIAGMLRVPYVILLPGPVTNTLGQVPSNLLPSGAKDRPVISITGRQTQPTNGKLYLTTVDQLPGDCNDYPTLWQAVRAWFAKSQTVYPHQLLCPPNQSASSVQQQNAAEMSQSQSDAVTAALFQLGAKPLTQHVSVGSVSSGTPAAKVLIDADVILAVDGTSVMTLPELRAALGAHPVGTPIRLTIQRADKTKTVTTTTIAGPDKQPVLGITADRVATFPGIHVSIGIDPNIVGGPSAGTALALGIIDKLTPGGITGGRTIAGTGTVDGFGTVGPIGGLQQKIAAAVKAGATVFFAPASECSEATSAAPKSLTLIKVDKLSTVVSALQDIKAGKSNFPHC